MDHHEIGRQVRYWRKRRGMTRRQFADRCGRSVAWVDKIESGERALLRLPLLETVAEVLGVEPSVLTGAARASAATRCVDAVEIGAIRQALQRVEAITGLYGTSTETVSDVGPLRRQAGYLWTSFQYSRYSVLGAQLPMFLITAQDAVASAPTEQLIDAQAVLSLAYQVTASMLWKLKEPDLAWLAAERGMTLAERTGDPLLVSDAARRVAHGLMATGHIGPALVLIGADMDRLNSGLGNASAEYLSVYGMLPLMGAVIAGRAGNAVAARDLLAGAATVAERQGEDRNEHWTAFGPTNVAVHRTSVLVELGEGGTAIECAQTISADGLAAMPRERRASHFLDVARGYALCGKPVEAAEHLVVADRLAEEEIRCRPAARDLIATLLATWPQRPPAHLRRLAILAGLPT